MTSGRLLVRPSRMLKKSASFVLASLRSSTLKRSFLEVRKAVGAFPFAKTYCEGERPTRSAVRTSSPLRSLRPCWTAFLSILLTIKAYRNLCASGLRSRPREILRACFKISMFLRCQTRIRRHRRWPAISQLNLFWLQENPIGFRCACSVKHRSWSLSKTCATGAVRRPKLGVRSSGNLEFRTSNRRSFRLSRLSPSSCVPAYRVRRAGSPRTAQRRDARFIRVNPSGPGHYIVTGLVCAK